MVGQADTDSRAIDLRRRSPPFPELLQLRNKQSCRSAIPHNLGRGSKNASRRSQVRPHCQVCFAARLHGSRCAMTARQSCSFRRISAILLLMLFAQSSALARGGGTSHDEPWNAEHIDGLPPEVRHSVLHMCQARPHAAHYFATYLDNARIIKLHFEHYSCEGRQAYRNVDGCLHQEYLRSGSRYRLVRNYYGRCDD